MLDPTLSTQPDEVMPLVDRSIEPIDRNATIVTSVDRSHFLPRFIDGAKCTIAQALTVTRRAERILVALMSF